MSIKEIVFIITVLSAIEAIIVICERKFLKTYKVKDNELMEYDTEVSVLCYLVVCTLLSNAVGMMMGCYDKGTDNWYGPLLIGSYCVVPHSLINAIACGFKKQAIFLAGLAGIVVQAILLMLTVGVV